MYLCGMNHFTCKTLPDIGYSRCTTMKHLGTIRVQFNLAEGQVYLAVEAPKITSMNEYNVVQIQGHGTMIGYTSFGYRGRKGLVGYETTDDIPKMSSQSASCQEQDSHRDIQIHTSAHYHKTNQPPSPPGPQDVLAPYVMHDNS